MNTEARSQEINPKKNYEANIVYLAVNGFLGPYLEHDDAFIPSALATKLGKFTIQDTIATVLDLAYEALREDTKMPYVNPQQEQTESQQKLTIGGSSMEVFSGLLPPTEYWATKKHCKNAYEKKPELQEESCPDRFRQALRVLAHGDPDLDLYVEHEKDLQAIFDIARMHFNISPEQIENTQSDGKQFAVKLNDLINATVYFGPVYKNSPVQRFYFQLSDAASDQNRSLFHIDITAKSIKGNKQSVDRRKTAGSVHDHCRGEVDPKTKTIKFDSNAIPKINEPSIMRLEDKDWDVLPETTMREMRKKLSHVAANKDAREAISLFQMFPLMQMKDIKYLKRFYSGLIVDAKSIISDQSEYQKRTLYRELFLMAQIDPYLTVIFLQDTGMDTVFFGRHLTRKEGLSILTSSWLKVGSDEQEVIPSFESANQSRQSYFKLDPNDPDRNGFECFIAAIGETFGDNHRNHKKHFQDGLNILRDGLPEFRSPEIILDNEKLSKMYDVIKIFGGITEKNLHEILSEKYPENFPRETSEDTTVFRKMFIELKLLGILEVARRNIIGEEEPLLFFYPRSNVHNINNHSTTEVDIEQASEAWQSLLKTIGFIKSTGFSDVSKILRSFNLDSEEENDLRQATTTLDTPIINLFRSAKFADAWGIGFTNILETALETMLGITPADWEILEEEIVDSSGNIVVDRFNHVVKSITCSFDFTLGQQDLPFD